MKFASGLVVLTLAGTGCSTLPDLTTAESMPDAASEVVDAASQVVDAAGQVGDAGPCKSWLDCQAKEPCGAGLLDAGPPPDAEWMLAHLDCVNSQCRSEFWQCYGDKYGGPQYTNVCDELNNCCDIFAGSDDGILCKRVVTSGFVPTCAALSELYRAPCPPPTP